MSNNPFAQQDYQSRKLCSARDALLLALDTAVLRANETLMDITDDEYNWEFLPEAERAHDLTLAPETKRVWRVFEDDGVYFYDYGLRKTDNPAFTTIAWIMNHIATTADMYLYCVKTGKQVGEELTWDDLIIYGNLKDMRDHIFRALYDTRDYLLALDPARADDELNHMSPAPTGEIRPIFLNLWGGVIEHTLMHCMQIAVRKERIRQGF